MSARFPGNCDHCDRTATSVLAWWDGGGPGLGQHHTSARCDYHLGNPPGSIPGRCWSCGQAIGDNPHTSTRDHGAPWILNVHNTCPTPLPGYRGPHMCAQCGDPIAYGQHGTATERPRNAGTIYTHQKCPR
jgi:hypothetical protein